MTRREALKQIAAGAAGATTASTGATFGMMPSPAAPSPDPDADMDAIIDYYDRVRPPLTPADVALERALLASHDLLDALDEVRTLHNIDHPDHDCPCELCYDLNGLRYILNSPFTLLHNEFVATKRLREREKVSQQFHDVLRAKAAASTKREP